MKVIKVFSIAILSAYLLLLSFLWGVGFFPKQIEKKKVSCGEDAPMLTQNQKLKIMSWNVQYMAGKNVVFWYDVPGGKGPDSMPKKSEIYKTIERVAEIVNDENADIIYFQELHDNSKRTYKIDELKNLLPKISKDYTCKVSAYYLHNSFNPHPKVLGPEHMKLTTLSKVKISKAIRHQLPYMKAKTILKFVHLEWLDSFIPSALIEGLNTKRAILESRLPRKSGAPVTLLNVHLDAFAFGSKTMQKQIAYLEKLMLKRQKEGSPVIVGGDFNLLASEEAYKKVDNILKPYYNAHTEITPMYNSFVGVPSLDDVRGKDSNKWFTHFSNNPYFKGPNKTIDYFFLSDKVKLLSKRVRSKDTLDISDHLPILIEVQL